MRVLAVSDYILEDGVVCGATRVLHGYLTELHRRGADVSLITPVTAPATWVERPTQGYTIYRYQYQQTPWWRNFVIDPGVDEIYQDMIRKPQIFSLVLAHLPRSAIKLIRKRYPISPWKTPPPQYIYIFHSPWHLEFETRVGRPVKWEQQLWRPFGSRLRWLAENDVVGFADRVVVLSHYMKDLLLKTHHSKLWNRSLPERVRVIPPGIDSQKFHPGDKGEARRRLGLPEDRLIAFTARSLIPRCGISQALQALAKLRGHLPEWLLLIAGDGPLRQSLEEEAARLAVHAHARFLGYLPDEQLPLCYQAADLFLLPTIALEGFGLVILEAWASGLPVLGTPVGAIPEILNPVTPELLLPDTSPESLAAALGGLAAEPSNLPLMGARCREYAAARYSWSRSCDLLLQGLG